MRKETERKTRASEGERKRRIKREKRGREREIGDREMIYCFQIELTVSLFTTTC